MTDPRLNNPASAADTRLLTGETTPAAQRAVCDRLGIRCHQRRILLPDGRRYRLVDECTVWVDHDVLARLNEKASSARG